MACAGLVPAPDPASRPQLDAAQARAYAYAEVLKHPAPWDPLSGALATRAPVVPDYVVDAAAEADGRRTFRTVQDAVSAALTSGLARAHILVRPGTYRELLYVPASPVAITLYGGAEDASRTRVSAVLEARTPGARYASQFGVQFASAPAPVAAMFASVRDRETVGTSGSAVAWIRNLGFEARDITFENAHNKDRGDAVAETQSQAVAVLVEDADRVHFENVRFLGFQDTLYLKASVPERPGRVFVNRSYIEGDMDFIFGEATAYFRQTEVRSLGDRRVSYVTAPSTHILSRYGFVFSECRFTHDGSPNALAGTFKLGRQWFRSDEAVGKVIILDSRIGAHIDRTNPWAPWDSPRTGRYRPVQFGSKAEPFLAEYRSTDEQETAAPSR